MLYWIRLCSLALCYCNTHCTHSRNRRWGGELQDAGDLQAAKDAGADAIAAQVALAAAARQLAAEEHAQQLQTAATELQTSHRVAAAAADQHRQQCQALSQAASEREAARASASATAATTAAELASAVEQHAADKAAATVELEAASAHIADLKQQAATAAEQHANTTAALSERLHEAVAAARQVRSACSSCRHPRVSARPFALFHNTGTVLNARLQSLPAFQGGSLTRVSAHCRWSHVAACSFICDPLQPPLPLLDRRRILRLRSMLLRLSGLRRQPNMLLAFRSSGCEMPWRCVCTAIRPG